MSPSYLLFGSTGYHCSGLLETFNLYLDQAVEQLQYKISTSITIQAS